MQEQFGDRQTQLFRELTKIHEECIEDSLAGLQERLSSGVKGELVLIVQGAELATPKPENLEALLFWYRDEMHSSLKDAVANISRDLGIPRSQVYKLALQVWKETL